MSRRPLVVHVAEIDIAEGTGMGRIAGHWRAAFQAAGFDFIHIGPGQAPRPPHKSLWHRAAWSAFLPMRDRCDIVLAHEAVSGIFAERFPRTAVFSHGIESRGARLCPAGGQPSAFPPLRRLLLRPLWRLREKQCLAGLVSGGSVLLSNSEDAAYLAGTLGRPQDKPVTIFRNGIDLADGVAPGSAEGNAILFFGTWLRRKGCDILVETAKALFAQGVRCRWILAGMGLPPEVVLADWPSKLRGDVQVIPHVGRSDEAALYRGADLFVLPSRFEGQPLTLLQAMAHGLCCVTTDCCGQKDLIADGRTGVLVEPGSSEALGPAIRRHLEDAPARARIGGAARDSVAGRAWDAVSGEVVETVSRTLMPPR
jgi:glycosyltransferase involved in cell wall biosynthesis